jgi:hypothetical protein
MHFVSVETTAKGGITTPLGRLTLILGPNGSGKTTIQNGLELTTRGFATDVAGRAEVRKSTDLVNILGDGQRLSARAVTDTGEVFEWSASKTARGSVSTPEFEPPMVVTWPVLDVEAMLKGNPETQRKWILKVAGRWSTRAVIHTFLTDTDVYDEYAARFKREWADHRPNGDEPAETDLLPLVLAQVGSDATQAKAACTAGEGTLNALSRGLAPEPTEMGIQALRDRLEVLRSAQTETLMAVAPTPPRLLEGQVTQAQAAAVTLTTRLVAAKEQIEEVDALLKATPRSPHERLLVSLAVATQELASVGASACFVCGSAEVPDWQAASDQWAAKSQDSQRAAAQEAKLTGMRQSAAVLQREAVEAISTWQALYAAYSEQGAEPVPEPTPAQPAANANALTELLAQQSVLSEALALQTSWQRVRDQRQMMKEATIRHRNLSALKTDCQKALLELVQACVSTFEDAVRSFLPETDAFRLVFEGKSVRMGFDKDGVLHSALSGAEWARMTLAVASAYIKLRGLEDALMILSPKERAFDAATLGTVLKALTNAPGQVLLTSPTRPKGRIPKEWTVIELPG